MKVLLVFGGGPDEGQPMEMLIAGEYTAWKTFGMNRGEYAFAATINKEIYMHGISICICFLEPFLSKSTITQVVSESV